MNLNKTLAFSAVFLSAGCTTLPQQGEVSQKFKEVFASDDPCSSNARNIGAVGGAVLGVVVANSLGVGKNGGQINGALLGGFLGGLIGADMDRKRCELSKVAKKYELELVFDNIQVPVDGPVVDAENTSNKPLSTELTVVGNTVSVRDKGGVSGHFESGSDQLTARAKEYFSAIAAQYLPDAVMAAQKDDSTKEEARKQLAQRRILLIGHTDDTGASPVNASLSERRAKAVASFLKKHGVPESSLYYQGAGETLPIGDNRTEEGRAKNRRVEIVEVVNEAGLKKYLENRKPQYSYYRAEVPSKVAAEPQVQEHPETAKAEVKPPLSAKQVVGKSQNAEKAKDSPAQPVKAVSNSAIKNASPAPAASINFGGVPYSPEGAKIDTGGILSSKVFSLISSAQAADDSVVLHDCSFDRPRVAGMVKSLRDGSTYKITDHLPQLYGKTWASDVNGNLVLLNHLAVLRGSGAPANLPELKIYAQYKPGENKKPEIDEEPPVNSYMVDKGLLYRVFPRGDRGVKCMDLLFDLDGSTSAKAGKIIYSSGTAKYLADYKPQVQ